MAKRIATQMKALISASDPEPVIIVCIFALLLFGGTLLWPGRSFDDSSFSIMAKMVPEEPTGFFLVGLALLATGLLVLNKTRLLRVICLVMVGVFAFLGTQFVLLGVNSTGNSYYVYAAASAWASWRLIFR